MGLLLKNDIPSKAVNWGEGLIEENHPAQIPLSLQTLSCPWPEPQSDVPTICWAKPIFPLVLVGWVAPPRGFYSYLRWGQVELCHGFCAWFLTLSLREFITYPHRKGVGNQTNHKLPGNSLFLDIFFSLTIDAISYVSSVVWGWCLMHCFARRGSVGMSWIETQALKHLRILIWWTAEASQAAGLILLPTLTW